MRKRFSRAAAFVFAAMAVLLWTPAFAGAFEIGFFDPVYQSANSIERSTWLDKSTGVGATVVRVMPSWAQIAPRHRPASFDPADPADPAYRWTDLDAALRDADARGLRVLLTLSDAPVWAQGGSRPRDAGGTWRPNAGALSAFATAAAERYSGVFPDPLNPGRPLPRVRHWQVWNEPNLPSNLQPQWTRHRGRYVTASPRIYRDLLNKTYIALKRVNLSNQVVTAGTGPYGDLSPGGRRIQPVAFWRALLSKETRFDAFAHHPYGIRGPLSHALNADDASIPDLGRISRVVHSAQRRGTVSRSRKSFWVTEISWDSRPPDPFGVPEGRHARWLEEALWQLWKQGVSTVTWFRARDQPKGEGYEFGNQSGVYLINGRPKLAATAFRFPLVVERNGRRAQAWGMAPAPVRTEIQRQVGKTWRRVATVSPQADRVFALRVTARRGMRFRAVAGSDASLVWTVR